MLGNTISDIELSSAEYSQRCEKYWDTIGKPLKSLGEFEKLWSQIAGCTQNSQPTIRKRCLVVFCADNGVVEEGVSQTGQEVTRIVAENFLEDKTCTAIFCKNAGCDLKVIDVGIAGTAKGVEKRKVSEGTKNFAKERAMSREQVIAAIEIGIRLSAELKNEGYNLLLTGEMGIGNTTTSSAVCSVLLGELPEVMTGKGAGLSDSGLTKKINVIKQALEKYEPDESDVIDVLSCVGGYDIAAMTGLYLGGAAGHIPVIMDGFISGTAALCAIRLCDRVKDYIVPSHISKEPAFVKLLKAIGKEPVLDAGMHLGEGSGGVMLLPLLDMIESVYTKMGTFDDIGVKQYEDMTEQESSN